MRFRNVSPTRLRSDKLAHGIRYEIDEISTDHADCFAVYRLNGEQHTQLGPQVFSSRSAAIDAANRDYWIRARAS